MNLQQSKVITQATRGGALVRILFRGLGLLICAAIVVFFGLVPFLLGVLVQVLSPKRIPSFVVGLFAIGAFFALRYFTDAPSVTVREGFVGWSFVLLALILFVAFFASGAALLCELLPRRSSSSPTTPTPDPPGNA